MGNPIITYYDEEKCCFKNVKDEKNVSMYLNKDFFKYETSVDACTELLNLADLNLDSVNIALQSSSGFKPNSPFLDSCKAQLDFWLLEDQKIPSISPEKQKTAKAELRRILELVNVNLEDDGRYWVLENLVNVINNPTQDNKDCLEYNARHCLGKSRIGFVIAGLIIGFAGLLTIAAAVVLSIGLATPISIPVAIGIGCTGALVFSAGTALFFKGMEKKSPEVVTDFIDRLDPPKIKN